MTENTGPAAGGRASEVVVQLMGGVKRRGAWRPARRTTLVTAVGGMNLDLTDAALPEDGIVLTKVSLVGGVDLTVPAGTALDVSGFVLIGRLPHPEPGEPGSGAAPIQVRCYGIFGGVEVHQR
jgi:hypothetical protein